MSDFFLQLYNNKLFQIVFTCIVAALMSINSIPVIIKISRLKNLMAEPGERSSHVRRTPTLGGVAIFASILISYFLWENPDEGHFVHLSISAIVILFFLGVKDDILILSPKKKMIIQIVASALVIIMGNLRLENLFGIFGIDHIPYLLSVPLTIFVFIALINAINLIDGIDGLAGGIGMIAGGTFGIWFYLNGHYALASLASAMAGSLLGFLRFNYSKTSKIFMGDTGSLLVGFLLTMFAIKFVQLNIVYRFDPNAIFSAPILAIVVLIVPIFDTVRVFMIRLMEKKSPFVGDRNHLHHILIDSGLTHFQASAILWAFSLVSTILFLVISKEVSNMTSLWLLFGIFCLYMWVSYLLKQRNQKRAELKSQVLENKLV
jgi:UDP-N-acetylmuramyl pentapeptide phosphotransferase/UDP-N-acetylglucosamine-1-phosphate transferase